MKKISVILCLFISTLLIAQNTTEPIKVKEFKLENGLTVMLSENHNVPQVFGVVAVKAGGKNDPKDATGIAHYLEHLLFKGTETMGTIDYTKEKPFLDEINNLYEKLGQTKDEEERKKIQKQINDQSKKAGEFTIANEMDKLLTQIGATGVNAFTTEDFTAYHNTFPSNQIERWLELYSHRFEKPVFRLFQSELETVYEEKNRSMDSGFGQVFEELLKNVYKKHPYGQQTILGSVEHLKNPSLQKMYEFYNTYYVANNMVLALSGDFDTETVIPLIEAKFSKWRSGQVPEFPKYEEEEFSNRELVVKKLTPVKIGILSFRTPESGHPDEIKLDLAFQILSNYEMTGFLDKISDEGKIMEAGAMPMAYNDYGTALIYYIPKIIGQKLEAAEAIVKEQLEKLKQGDFSDEYFKAIKLNKQKEIDLLWEDNQDRSYEMILSFTQNRKWDDYYARYKSIEDITKQDVIEVANKYFNDNYLCFNSKMGFPKKEKLSKPGFEPIESKNEVKSEFGEHFMKIKTTKSTPTFVNFEKDIISKKVNDYFTINQVKNPFNEVFDLEIKYGVGKYKIPVLQQVEYYLTLLGTKDKSVLELKEAYHNLGASYYFEASDETFSMHISGMEENLEEILKITRDFITNVQPDERKVKQMLGDLKAEKKINRREPGYTAQSLNAYILLGDKAPLLRELTKKQLKKLTGQELITAYQEVLNYETTVNFVGNRNISHVAELCNKYLVQKEKLEPKQDILVLDRIVPSNTKIYVVNNKKAVQSQIVFNVEGSARDNKKGAQINAFNSYFGGGMSSLVFQEIREFRSLAYSAYGNYTMAKKEGKNNMFTAYIGCQADKTNDAIDAMLELINHMPEKSERMEMIRSSIIEETQSSKPNFRDLLSKVETWKTEGYQTDPNEIYLKEYDKMNFEDLVKFYKTEIQNKPLSIAIVGDVKRFDLKKLEQYGEVIKIKASKLYVN